MLFIYSKLLKLSLVSYWQSTCKTSRHNVRCRGEKKVSITLQQALLQQSCFRTKIIFPSLGGTAIPPTCCAAGTWVFRVEFQLWPFFPNLPRFFFLFFFVGRRLHNSLCSRIFARIKFTKLLPLLSLCQNMLQNRRNRENKTWRIEKNFNSHNIAHFCIHRLPRLN